MAHSDLAMCGRLHPSTEQVRLLVEVGRIVAVRFGVGLVFTSMKETVPSACSRTMSGMTGAPIRLLTRLTACRQ